MTKLSGQRFKSFISQSGNITKRKNRRPHHTMYRCGRLVYCPIASTVKSNIISLTNSIAAIPRFSIANFDNEESMNAILIE